MIREVPANPTAFNFGSQNLGTPASHLRARANAAMPRILLVAAQQQTSMPVRLGPILKDKLSFVFNYDGWRYA